MPRPAAPSALAFLLVVLANLPIARSEAAEIPRAERRSAYEDMAAETRAIQDDDTANPGMLWVLEGAGLWRAKPAPAARTCADCHGDAGASMKGVAARHPAFDAKRGAAVDLEDRINVCRSERQDVPALARESRELLALTAFVARQSRSMPIDSSDPRLEPTIAAGRTLFHTRQGQLNLSCAQCHDDNWGKKLAGITVPQGQPTGYPLYRLEWQAMGSLQRRLRNCMIGMRAESYAYGSPEFLALEAFLMRRAAGLPIEAPAVRP